MAAILTLAAEILLIIKRVNYTSVKSICKARVYTYYLGGQMPIDE